MYKASSSLGVGRCAEHGVRRPGRQQWLPLVGRLHVAARDSDGRGRRVSHRHVEAGVHVHSIHVRFARLNSSHWSTSPRRFRSALPFELILTGIRKANEPLGTHFDLTFEAGLLDALGVARTPGCASPDHTAARLRFTHFRLDRIKRCEIAPMIPEAAGGAHACDGRCHSL